MFDQLEIKVLPPGLRFVAQPRVWVNGEDVVEGTVEEGVVGRTQLKPCLSGRPSPLRATSEARRVVLG